jgi:EXPERA (EXPanded EBP superfamily)
VSSLKIRERRFDLLFIIFFSWAFISSMISDAIPTLGIVESPTSHNILSRINYQYASVNDPLFLHPPIWMRFVTGLSAFVYGPFYLLLVYALIKGKNWIQLWAVIYGTLIVGITGVVVFGVEFFGEPQWRTPHPWSFLAYNLPYVLIPLLLIIRMRSPEPFNRKF